MLVLIITLVITTSVSAEEYTASDDYTISSQYHDVFNNYFNDSKSYLYFSYDCYYGDTLRHCYYGIDEENNYLKIDYQTSGYNYVVNYTSGIDEEFSVNGINIYRHQVNVDYSILYLLCFSGVIILVNILWKG